MENLTDIIVILIICAFALSGFLKGALLSAYDAVSFVAAFIAANYLSGFIGALIRNSDYFASIKESVSNALGLEKLAAETTLKAQNALIGALELPDALKELLMVNNNPEIYGIFNARDISEYIASFLANAAVSVIACVCAFAIVLVLINVVRGILGALKKTGGFNMLDSILGAALGIAKALAFIWLGLLAVTFFAPANPGSVLVENIKNSTITLWLYENNFLLKIISFF
jgi:uncharacterized membrane protein required for colicin V production